jgi:hypothetical protein
VEDRSIRLAEGVQQGLASSHWPTTGSVLADQGRFTKERDAVSTVHRRRLGRFRKWQDIHNYQPCHRRCGCDIPVLPLHAVARPARLGDLPRAAFAASLAAAMLDGLACRTASPLSCLRVELLSRPGTATRLTPRVPWTLRNGPLKSGRHASVSIVARFRPCPSPHACSLASAIRAAQLRAPA